MNYWSEYSSSTPNRDAAATPWQEWRWLRRMRISRIRCTFIVSRRMFYQWREKKHREHRAAQKGQSEVD